MAYNSTGSVAFTTGGELRAFNFTVSVADERLRLEIEDSLTYEKWRTRDLEIHEFVTEHTIITQAQASDYATLIVRCMEHSAKEHAAESMFSSLSKQSDTDGSRLLCVSFPVQIAIRSVIVEYTFTLFLQPVDHMKRLTRENEQLQAQKAKLTDENEQLTRKQEKLTRRSAAELEQQKLENEKLTRACKKLEASVRELTERITTERKQHQEEVLKLARKIAQLEVAARKSASSIRQPAPTAIVAKQRNPRVFLDLFEPGPCGVGKLFRIEIELFADVTPNTAKFFRWLCTDQLPSHAIRLEKSMTAFDRVSGTSYVEYFDVEMATGYHGPAFVEDVSPVRPDTPGIVSMSSISGRVAEMIQILTSLQTKTVRDEVCGYMEDSVVFGRVVSGMEGFYDREKGMNKLYVRNSGQLS